MKHLRSFAATAAFLCALAPAARAHGGHGIAAEWHWHASDAWGFLALAAGVAIIVWLTRGDGS